MIFMMELKNVGHKENPENVPRVWQIAHSYSSGCYSAMPKAVTNRAGTRIYFTSKWEYQRKKCSRTDIYETYIVELPKSWFEELKGNKGIREGEMH